MKLNLFTNGHKLIDTAETKDDIFSIEPTTNEAIGKEIYPRITYQLFDKNADQVDIHVKIPSGMSAKFSESGGIFYIEPILLS